MYISRYNDTCTGVQQLLTPSIISIHEDYVELSLFANHLQSAFIENPQGASTQYLRSVIPNTFQGRGLGVLEPDTSNIGYLDFAERKLFDCLVSEPSATGCPEAELQHRCKSCTCPPHPLQAGVSVLRGGAFDIHKGPW